MNDQAELGAALVELLRPLVAELVAEEMTKLVAREDGKRWLTVPEAAVYLGCSERAIYARIRRGRIPEHAVKRSGRTLLLDRLALDRDLSRS